MRKTASLMAMAAMAAMVVQGPATASQPEMARHEGGQGYCRQPAALPGLGAEGEERQDQLQSRYSREKSAPGYAPVPPPPPPPPPPSAPLASGAGGEDVVVTARRIEGPAQDVPVTVNAITSDSAGDEAGEIVTTARRVDGKADRTRRPEKGEPEAAFRRLPPRPQPQPQPQSGLLTAGEHDDLLNPELYADYVRRSNLGQSMPDLPKVDTGKVLTVAVKDRSGRPVPFATVEVACSDGNRLQLSTMADGTVAFFPGVDRLSPQVQVRAAASEWRAVSLAGGRGGQRMDFTIDRPAAAVNKLDLMLVVDTTGSMGDEIRYLQAELGSIVESLRARHRGLDIRIGFVFYRDVGDDYVTVTLPLSKDIDGARREIARRSANGGGDTPEAMDQALIRAAGQDWRPDAVRSLLLVADAPPHDENVGRTWLAAEHLRASRVHIVPVAASGVEDKAEYVMRAMAAATQSRYTFLTDDSGIGNPHAAPAIDCYLVTRLDALLRRVIDSQIAGRRIEPDQGEVMRSVGDYDAGRCIIPRGWQGRPQR